MKGRARHIFILFLLNCLFVKSQNETTQWYFGYGAGLDFMNSPPSLLANSSMTVDEGCASISDAGGNLLFYTDGMTIWTKTHTVMANGNGLLGGHSSTQSSIILKEPGSSSLYYVFTVQGNTWAPGLHYSIVDMSLANGQGSVTAKNVNIYAGSLYEKITAGRHCNGTDFWIVVRDFSSTNLNNSGNFHAYQFSASGISTTDVVSAFTYTSNFHVVGAMKLSPNGRKLACANYNFDLRNTTFELFDFDSSTGIVSNSVALVTSFVNNVNSFFASGYGVEFSPDCTKLYGSLGNFYATYNNGNILEWDLCAGTNSAIANSQTTISAATGTNYFGVGSLQLAKDGKIYVAHSSLNNNVEALSVINNPNGFGSAANFAYGVLSVNSFSPHWGLPNYGSYYFLQHPTPPPYTAITNTAAGCHGMSFAPGTIQNTIAACDASSYSVNAYAWDFGDPLTGSNNTSFLSHPSHNFSAPGTYTTQLVIYYSCGGGTDTLRQTVVVTGSSSLTINTGSITCASLGSATVGVSNSLGSYAYSWTPTNQTTSIATGLIPGTYTISVFSDSLNCSITNTVYFAPLVPLTATVVNSQTVACFGATTGTATFINISGGSANQNYLWTMGATTFTTSTVNGLSAGSWSATITDALTACQVHSVFTISQPPSLSLSISPPSFAGCVGTNIILSASCSGGTAGYSYLWSNASAASSIAVNGSTPSTQVYTLSAQDYNNCAVSQTVALQFVPVPTINVSSGAICQGESFVISPSGASNYTYSSGSATVNPVASSAYLVTGDVLGCPASNTAICFVTVNSLPTVSVNSGSICAGKSFTIYPSGANSYTFLGGNAVVSPTSSASYAVIGSNTSGCESDTAFAGITVISLPQVVATSNRSMICTGESATLAASGASVYSWGPLGNTPSIVVSPSATTNYTVTGTDIYGCSQSFIMSQQVSNCAGVQETNGNPNQSPKIFPNPNPGEFSIVSTRTLQLLLVNTLGQVLKKISLEKNNDFSVHVAELANGVYYLVGDAGINANTQKIVVNR